MQLVGIFTLLAIAVIIYWITPRGKEPADSPKYPYTKKGYFS